MHGLQFEAVGQRFADRREGVVDDVRHGQHRRPGVEAVAGDIGPPDSAAGMVTAFDHGDVATAAGQLQRRGQPGQPGTDDDDPVGSSLHGAHQAARSSADDGHVFQCSARHFGNIDSIETAQRLGQTLIDEPLDPLHGSAGDDQGPPVFDFGGARRRRAHQFRELAPQSGARELMSGDDHAGGLLRHQVGADGFAGDRRRTEDTEKVVTQLKRLADRGAVPAERVEDLRCAAGHRPSDLQGSPHRVVARFPLQHVEHLVERREGAGVVDQIGELADRQLDTHVVVARPRPRERVCRNTTFAKHFRRPHEAQIAEQYRGRLTESARRARQPALAVPPAERDVCGRPPAA